MTRQKMLTLASIVVTFLASAAAQVPAAFASVFEAPPASAIAASAAAAQPAGTQRGNQEAATGAAGIPAGACRGNRGRGCRSLEREAPRGLGPGAS